MRGSSLVAMGVLALLFSVDRVAAQNLFEIYPTRPNISTTDYTRLGLTGAGEILIEVAPMHFCNVGGSTTCNCTALEIDVTVMDMDDATANTFCGVVCDPFGTQLGITLPQLTTVGGGGPSVETFRVPFTVPVVLPCTGTFYFGIKVDAPACSDGIYVAAARYAGPGCGGETGRAGAPSLLFTGPGVPVAWLGPKLFSLRMGLTVDAPVLNMGNQNPVTVSSCLPWRPGYGVGGLYPFNPGGIFFSDTLWARVQDVANPGGTAVLFASVTPWVPLCLPPYGMLCIYPEIAACTIPLDSNGLGTCSVLTLTPNMPILSFQAVSLNSLQLSNAEVTRP